MKRGRMKKHMRNIKKITVLSLFLAIVLLAGGTCVLPMSSAQAADMGMSDMSAMPTDGYSVQSTHCPETSDAGCGSAGSQGGFLSCFLSCGSSVSKTATVKKIQDAGEGPLILDVPTGLSLRETKRTDHIPGIWMKTGEQEERHLSVAKKE